MENKNQEKNRTVSSTSSASSVTEYVNEMYEESELELSKVVSIQVENDEEHVKKSPESSPHGVDNIKLRKNLQDFSEGTDSSISSSQFITKGFRKMYLAALIVLLFAACMGATGTYSATAGPKLKKSPLHPTDDQLSWIASLMPVGALVGGTAGGVFTNALGRKTTLLFNSLPFVGGWLLIAYAKTVGMIYLGRLITGFCSGIVSVATPMYLVEIATLEVRGLFGASFQLFVVIGIFLISSLGSKLEWTWLAISGGLLCFFSFLFMLPMPESPRWLVSKKKTEEAKKAILFLQGELFDADAELKVLEDEAKNQPTGGVNFTEFKNPWIYKPFILSILLMFFQQFSGVNAVLFYTVDIFTKAKVQLNAFTCTIIVALVQVIATLLGSVLMDRAGRKPLLLISAVCMAICLLVFGGYDFAKIKDPTVTEKIGWLPIICLTCFIAAFSIGYGPTPWLMVAEMTPMHVRSVVSGVATALNWTFVFIITYTFQKLVDGIHNYGVYWLYAGFCACSVAVTVIFLPETKGKNIEEIEHFFRKGKM